MMGNGNKPEGTFFDNLQAAAEAPDPRPEPSYADADLRANLARLGLGPGLRQGTGQSRVNPVTQMLRDGVMENTPYVGSPLRLSGLCAEFGILPTVCFSITSRYGY